MGVDTARHSDIAGEGTVTEHVHSGNCQTLRAGDNVAPAVRILPTRARTGVHQHTHSCEVNHSANFFHLVTFPTRHKVGQVPLVEVAPPRMVRNFEVGIVFLCKISHEIDNGRKLVEVQKEVFGFAVFRQLEHLSAPFSYHFQGSKLNSQVASFLLTSVVASSNLGIDLNVGVLRNVGVWDRDTLHDFNTSFHNGVVFFAGHRQQPVDTLDTQPTECIGHQLLEAGVLNSCNGFCLKKIFLSPVTAFLVLSSVVDAVLSHFTQASSFFLEVHHNPDTTALGNFHAAFDGEDQVWAAGADIGTKNVRTAAGIMDTYCDFSLRVAELSDISKKVASKPT
mmetsp:Transcript_10778/g.15559  ORF Transcript_10778/g.15559 Transcript_10778/m.15559 type:complete len:337 (+) Transcript_10778:1323-2333(+)